MEPGQLAILNGFFWQKTVLKPDFNRPPNPPLLGRYSVMRLIIESLTTGAIIFPMHSEGEMWTDVFHMEREI